MKESGNDEPIPPNIENGLSKKKEELIFPDDLEAVNCYKTVSKTIRSIWATSDWNSMTILGRPKDKIDIDEIFLNLRSLKEKVNFKSPLYLKLRDLLGTLIQAAWELPISEFREHCGGDYALRKIISNIKRLDELNNLISKAEKQSEIKQAQAGKIMDTPNKETPLSQPSPNLDSTTVVLTGPGDPVFVLGKEKKPLSKPRYDTIKALICAGEDGLTKDELDRKSGHTDSRKFLYDLVKKDSDWKKVLSLPVKSGNRYRIRL